jgi:hypothetical protein
MGGTYNPVKHDAYSLRRMQTTIKEVLRAKSVGLQVCVITSIAVDSTDSYINSDHVQTRLLYQADLQSNHNPEDYDCSGGPLGKSQGFGS